jgi:peroxiredoxin
MANKLTGSYDAVAQVSRRQLNGLIASLHQNGASDQPPLRLGHNGVLRVGDPKPTTPELVRLRFRNWIRNFQVAGGPSNLDEFRARLAVNAPPGAGKMIEEEFYKLEKGRPGKLRPGRRPSNKPRGRVKLQLSSPTVTLADGATSEATLVTDVRAHYDPDSGAGDIAAADHPLHGEVRAAFELSVLSSASGRKLSVRPSSKDSKIQFVAASGTGLTSAEVSRISGELRDIVRDKFTPQPVDLPPDFPFSEFKVIGSGANQVVALPIQVSDSPLPTGRIQNLDENFADSSGFAFAASKEYVEGLLDPLFDAVSDAVRDFKKEITVGVTVFGFRLKQTIKFTLQLKSGPSLEWESNKIKLSAGLKLVVRPGADVSFRFTQKFKLVLDASTQQVTLEADGNSLVNTDLPFNFLHEAFENAIKAARDDALSDGASPVNDAVNQVFAGARQKLIGGLKVFDESASATFTTVKITKDGLIVRGEIGSGPRQLPMVQFTETDDGRAFSALATWIPGGKIDRYIWSWVGHSGKGPAKLFASSHRSFTASHRFIFQKPVGMDPLGNVSLRIEGTQTGADGLAVPITAESPAQLRNAFGTIVESPAWWAPIMTPIWFEETEPDARLKDLIAGHVPLQSDQPRGRELAHNTLIYFPDWRADEPLEPVAYAMAAMRRRKVSLVLIVVLPEDALNSRRSDVEAKLHAVSSRFAGRLMVTVDQEAGWSRAFAIVGRPSAHLVDARRRFVWNSSGNIVEPAAMAAALDKHIVPAPAPRSRALQPRISSCGCGCNGAPDIVIEDERGERFVLHRMRGRNVILNFFQSWSAPCIRELQRLQALQSKRPKGGGPYVVAFHGGNDEKAVANLRKRHSLSFPLVQDRDQAIARQYGITCWPTTIAINPDGSIGRMQLGAVREAKPATRPAKSTSA